MLSKKNRNEGDVVSQLFKYGRTIPGENLNLKFSFSLVNTKKTPPKISFVAPKTLVKNSSARNALRRKGYRAIEKKMKNLPAGLVGVFIFKRKDLSDLNLEKEIEKILSKVNKT